MSDKTTRYYQDGELVIEKTEGFKSLQFLYTSFVGRIVRKFLNKYYVGKLMGVYQCSFFSKKNIAPFINRHAINMSDFIEPTDGYRSFNDFFIRKIKPNARNIDQKPQIIVSPADGKLLVIPDISQKTSFFVKNKQFNLVRFLQDTFLARSYHNGTMMIVRLAPYDYHRFHFPIDCVPSSYRIIKGVYESVNPLVYRSGLQPLTENQRHIITLKTDLFDDILMIPVGAMCVGRITYTYKADEAYKKGEESGFFEFGGSTIVLLFKKDIVRLRKEFVRNSLQGFETAVKMGQAMTE